MDKLKIVRINKDVKMPTRGSKLASGLDLYAYNFTKLYTHSGGNSETLLEGDKLKSRVRNNTIDLNYLERVLIDTGIKATVGPGYEIQIRPRSGLALKQGLTVLNTPGTVNN